MIERAIADELIGRMEMHTGQTWPSCVCAAVAATNGSKWFSEYHTYASWLLSKHPQRIGRVDSVRFPRNTIAWKQKLRHGDCCLADSEVCRMTASGEDDRSSFFTVVEEHKPRYRDDKCRDGWRAPRLPGRLAHQVKTNGALSLSAWVFEFYDNDYARAGITAVASLLLVQTQADVVVFALDPSAETLLALQSLGRRVRVIKKTRQEAYPCPHKVVRAMREKQQSVRETYANIHLDCSKLPWALELQHYAVVAYVDSDFLFLTNADPLLVEAIKRLKRWSSAPSIIVASNPSNSHLVSDAAYRNGTDILLTQKPKALDFQAGLMVVRPDANLRTAFISMLNARRDSTAKLESTRGDQTITRLFFKGKVAWAHPRYNFPVNKLWEDRSACVDRVRWLVRHGWAASVHFSAGTKPWLPNSTIRAVIGARRVSSECLSLFWSYVCAWRQVQAEWQLAVHRQTPLPTKWSFTPCFPDTSSSYTGGGRKVREH